MSFAADPLRRDVAPLGALSSLTSRRVFGLSGAFLSKALAGLGEKLLNDDFQQFPAIHR